MKNLPKAGPGYIPSAQVMYLVRSHAAARRAVPIKKQGRRYNPYWSAFGALHGELPLRPSLSPARTGRDKAQVSDKIYTVNKAVLLRQSQVYHKYKGLS